MSDDDAKRQELAKLLKDGLQTDVTPRADDQAAWNRIIAELRTLAPDDDVGKLKAGGFTDYTYVHHDLEQPCETCMYYLKHRKFCELPELMLPVEPAWSCRLWRI
ncbi:MAG: hypothetical protein R3F54_19465 [Alphaproteobacteria bacterium]